jgi:hypothetical protein
MSIVGNTGRRARWADLHHLSGVPIDYPAVAFAEDDAKA